MKITKEQALEFLKRSARTAIVSGTLQERQRAEMKRNQDLRNAVFWLRQHGAMHEIPDDCLMPVVRAENELFMMRCEA